MEFAFETNFTFNYDFLNLRAVYSSFYYDEEKLAPEIGSSTIGTFMIDLSINNLFPILKEAKFHYSNIQADDPFDIDNPIEATNWGYGLFFQINNGNDLSP